MSDEGRGRGRRRTPSGPPSPQERERRAAARAAGEARRRASVPEITYPDLPVVARKDDIMAAIRDHQVVVIAGETGSGKTTQIPKMCLELGRGVTGHIGHTQPRRIAARSVAERLAEELDVELGQQVGYQVRFTDQANRDTLVKVMTDGILLTELQRDRDLRRYDTIIIDEAHERSLNIDFLLGYLRQLLPRRPDLKVIVTSATIDPEAFARHFAAPDGTPAPIIEVSGRTYPVEIRYRPLLRETRSRAGELVEEEVDQVTGIVEAVEELWTEDSGVGAGELGGDSHDILVFLSGEREIRDAAEALTSLNLPGTQILPLYGRLSADEQHRVFSRHSGRRVVLATNVAETSLTVPGIRYVVDAGTARISRYSQRTKVQRLPIEPISQASANQRSGRCGRLADGIAIRLYSEDDYAARPEFTDPEILRTNLASVILRMTSLGLGDLARFPFVERPDSRQITDGMRLLHELGAIAEVPDLHNSRPSTGPEGRRGGDAGGGARRTLTPIGRRLADIPLDPRLARMVVEADHNGALAEVLVIAAALSIQDVRERPTDKQTQADQQHARFKDEDSDFVTQLNLWRYLKKQQKDLSGSAFRRMCRDEYLHYLRIREWQDLHSQLKQVVKSMGLEPNRHPAGPEAVHRSLLAGLLSHVGLRDRETRDYLGARGARFAIQPGSTLFRRPPDWVMAAELVETTRLWARTNAVVDPLWVEEQGAHLLKRSYSEPRWSKSRGSAVATERVTLYGVPLVVDRAVAFGKIDPELSRELFIRHALVEEDWDTPHRFFHDNRKLVKSIAELETRARRRDMLVDDETLFRFYDERIPAEVVSAAHFDQWWKGARRRDASLLTFTEDVVLADEAGEAIEEISGEFPTEWTQDDLTFRLTYQFEPGADADGVTVHIPVDVLNRVRPVGFDWQVPGLRSELAVALLKSLPKATRKHFVPTPNHAAAALAHVDGRGPDSEAPFTDELAHGLYVSTGHRVSPDEWDAERVPDHLRMTFRVEDGRRRSLGEGTDLEALQEALAPAVRTQMKRAAADVERTGLTSWTLGELPTTFERASGARTMVGYPALVDHGESVAVEVLGSAAEQAVASRQGVRRLLLLGTTAPWPRILSLLTNQQKLALGNNPHGSVPALLDDALAAAVDAIVERLPGGTVRTEAEFEAALAAVRQQIVPTVIDVVALAHPVLDLALRVRLALDSMKSPATARLQADLRGQLAALIYPGFLAETGLSQLGHLSRYLKAMTQRIDKAPADLRRDGERQDQVERVEAERAKVVASLPSRERDSADVIALRWMTEELRVSLFAQSLGTAYPVSEKRIYKAMDAVEDAHAR